MDVLGETPQVVRDAILVYGAEAQKSKTIEELTELSLTIQHHFSGKCDAEDLAGEVADVFIMCHSMTVMLGRKWVEEKIKYKLERLVLRIEIEKQNKKETLGG